MIITLIFAVAFIVGIVCFIIWNKVCWDNGWILGIALGLIFIGAIGFLTSVFTIIDVNVNKDINYQNTLYEREIIEYRIDHMDENIVGSEMLYNDIVGFNNELRNIKKWANNPWTNWFWNEDIATIDYIELNRN